MKELLLKNIYNEDVKLIIVDKEEDASFITHSGTFHADEVMATCILLNKYNEIKLFRTNSVSKKDAFIYDIGFGKFDHHAIEFDKKRNNNIKYASCGLIWEEYGKEIINKLGIKNVDEFFESIDKNIIMDIDRDDNGQELDVVPMIKQQNISSLIASFNPAWNSVKKENDCFLEAVIFSNTILNNMIGKMKSKEDAKDIIEEKINESKNGILILDCYMPWKDIVLLSKNEKAKSILYAIFPSKRGGYNVVATPKEIGSFSVKKPFPSSWGGKENEELQTISKVKTITFCHKGLFICACKTFDDAIEIAKKAINE